MGFLSSPQVKLPLLSDKVMRKENPNPAPTTPQSLGALLKSARDIMGKDKGREGKAKG